MNLGSTSLRRGRLRLFGTLMAICLGAVVPRGAAGVDFDWNVNGSGLFNAAGNWDPAGGPPNDAADAAMFDQSATYTVTFQTGQTNNLYRVRNGSVTFALSGQTYSLTGNSFVGDVDGQSARLTLFNGMVTGGNLDIGDSAADSGFLTVTTNAALSTGTFNVGDSGTGTLTIQNGGVVASAASSVGTNTTSLGTATVAGAGSSWNASGNLTIGNNGTGTLNISSGGSANTSATLNLGSNPLGDGTATVSGTGSLLSATTGFLVGGSGRGSLTVSNGATAQSASTANIGSAVGSSGDVTITGAGSTLFVGSTLSVGSSGSGSLEVLAGGIVNSGATIVGSASSGTVVVDGSGSTWNVSGATTLGNGAGGDGFMFVTGGGAYHATSAAFTIGNGSVGNLTVSGSGSLVSAPSATLDIGVTGSGTLNISDGGVVTSSSARLALSTGGIGTATVTGAGSTWNSGNLTIGSANGGNAALTVGSGGTVNAGNITLVDPAGAPTATLTMNTGAAVNATNGFTRGAGALAFNGGLLHVSGGTFVNGSTPTQLSLSGASASDEPTLRLSNNAQTVNLPQIAVGLAAGRRAAVEVQSGADLTLSGAGSSSVGINIGSVGSVLVSGAGSTLSATGQELRVGEFGLGTLSITNGGTAALRDTMIGLFSFGTGTISVDGSDSGLTSSTQLHVGIDGRGTLNVINGARLDGATIAAGSNGTGNGTILVDGVGSVVSATTSFIVGRDGSGTLTVQNGGALDAPGSLLQIGSGTTTGTGTVTVHGAGAEPEDRITTWVKVQELRIGNATGGQATLNVLTGGGVEVTSDVTLSDPAGVPNGVLTIDGGSLTVGRTFTRRGVLQFNDGTLNIGGVLDNGIAATPLVINGATTAANPTLRMVSSSSTANISDLTIGQSRTGTLFVESGSGVNATNMFIGVDPGSTGLVTNEGFIATSASLAVGGGVGPGGQGTLNVANGASVSAGTTFVIYPQGTVNLNGGELAAGLLFNTGTLNFNAGVVRYTGTILLNDAQLTGVLGPAHALGSGRTIRSNDDMALSADLTVNGGRLQTDGVLNLSAGRLRVSSGAAEAMFLTNVAAGATLSIEGGSFNVTASSLQVLAGGEVEMHGGASTITTSAGLVNNGLVRGDGRINARLNNNSVGEVRVGGGQRLHFTSTLAGQTNGGLINVTGGTIEFAAVLTNSESTGLIAARDGVLRFTNGLTNNGSLTATIGISDIYGDISNSPGGRIVVSGGGFANFYDDVTNSGTINVSAAGTLKSTAVFFGSLSGAGVGGAGQVFVEGDMRPGFSPGTMAFGGDLSFGPLASLDIEIGGVIPGTQFDRVTVADSVFLDGTLDVSTIDGFSPTLPGQSFSIVTAASRTGEFSDVLGRPSAALPGLFWTVEYTPTSAILSTSALPGDIDLDGDVDREDAALFARSFGLGTGATWGTGDFDGDLAATLKDLALLQAHLGQGLPAASPAAVPEPSTFLMLLSAVALASLARPLRRCDPHFSAR